jgi:hypothetical protein
MRVVETRVATTKLKLKRLEQCKSQQLRSQPYRYNKNNTMMQTLGVVITYMIANFRNQIDTKLKLML